MRIKPAFVTGAATIVALSAVGVVVVATEPSQAQPALVWLLWAALFLASWGLLCTLLLLVRQSIAQSVWSSLLPAVTTVGVLMTLRRGMFGKRLLEAAILATLVLSFAIWYGIRRMHHHAGHTTEN